MVVRFVPIRPPNLGSTVMTDGQDDRLVVALCAASREMSGRRSIRALEDTLGQSSPPR